MADFQDKGNKMELKFIPYNEDRKPLPLQRNQKGMAVATIIKEYGWGTYYLGDEGFISLTNKIASVQ